MDETAYPDRLFACLLRRKEEYERESLEFDERCSHVIVERLRVRAQGLSVCLSVCLSVSLSVYVRVVSVCSCVDVRLNPVLMKSCMSDINSYCQRELNEVKTQKIESEGRVMYCLRKRFAAKVWYL